MINALAKQIAEHANVLRIEEVIPKGGETFGPWTVLVPGAGDSFWFWGSNPAIFLPTGTIISGLGRIWKMEGTNLKPWNPPSTEE